MLVAISKYLVPLEQIDTHRAAHVAYIQPFFAASKLLAGGRQVPATGAIILAGNISRAEFEKILAEDPYTLAGVAEYSVFEFNISLASEKFQQLYP